MHIYYIIRFWNYMQTITVIDNFLQRGQRGNQENKSEIQGQKAVPIFPLMFENSRSISISIRKGMNNRVIKNNSFFKCFLTSYWPIYI